VSNQRFDVSAPDADADTGMRADAEQQAYPPQRLSTNQTAEKCADVATAGVAMPTLTQPCHTHSCERASTVSTVCACTKQRISDSEMANLAILLTAAGPVASSHGAAGHCSASNITSKATEGRVTSSSSSSRVSSSRAGCSSFRRWSGGRNRGSACSSSRGGSGSFVFRHLLQGECGLQQCVGWIHLQHRFPDGHCPCKSVENPQVDVAEGPCSG
jgi:hypothetical protein